MNIASRVARASARGRTGSLRQSAQCESLEHRVLCSGSAAVPRPDHVVVVLEEDQAYSQILGPPPVPSLWGAGGVPTLQTQAPYIQALAASGASLTQAHSVGHPNEITHQAIFSGLSPGRPAGPWIMPDAPNLASELNAAGLSFVGYAESLPRAGYTGPDQGNYKRDHIPWVDFSNVPPSENMPFSRFPAEFSKLPTVSFVVPNLQNDMHSGTIAQGDQWLQANLGEYAEWAMSHNSLLIVTWDESRDGGNQIPTIFYGPMVEPGQYGQRIDQSNILRTIEQMYGLAPTGNAAAASPISAIFDTERPHDMSDAHHAAAPRGAIRGKIAISQRALAANHAQLAGWQVYIDVNGDGTFEPGEPFAITNRRGQFVFKHLSPGSYRIAVIPRAEYQVSGSQQITLGAQIHTRVIFSEQLI